MSTGPGSAPPTVQSASTPATGWARYAALGGVAFAIMLVVSAFISGASPPSPDDPVSKIAAYYTQHHTGVLLGDFIGVAATFPVVFFLAALWRAVRHAESSGVAAIVSVVGIALGGAIINVLYVIDSALDYKAAKILAPAAGTPAGGTLRALYDVSHSATAYVWFPIAASILAVAILAWQTGFLPRWLGIASFIVTVVMVIGTFSVFADKQNLVAAIDFIAFILFVLWTLVTGILLYLKPQGATSP